MIRLAPIIALLVVSLCASATSASAECAWVLWMSVTELASGAESWSVLAAFSAEQPGALRELEELVLQREADAVEVTPIVLRLRP